MALVQTAEASANGTATPRRVPLSAYILTYNEERNLDACLASLHGWAGEIYVVDSYSTDRTLEIAAKYGARVVQNRFSGHSAQHNWTLANVPFTHDWILSLDADQRVTPELREELARVLPQAPPDVAGYFVRRRQIFRGRWIRFGGYYPKHMLKLFRRRAAHCDVDEIDSRFYVQGKTARLGCDIVEDNVNENDIGFWIDKHNHYATKHAIEELKRRRGAGFHQRSRLFGNPDERVHWLKERWYQLPLYLRPFLYFFYRYVVLLGFLDGKQGFVFHFLQAFWFRLLIDIKLEELLRGDAHRPAQ